MSKYIGLFKPLVCLRVIQIVYSLVISELESFTVRGFP